MAFNDEKFRLFWRFASDEAKFLALATSQGYDVDNLKRGTLSKLWKSGSLVNLVDNNGFETGDFTDWSQNSAVIDSTVKLSGGFSSKLTASGAAVTGAAQAIRVEDGELYQVLAWGMVDAHTADDYRIEILPTDSDNAPIGSALNILLFQAVTDWTIANKTFGFTGSGADLILPAGTAFVTLRQRWSGTPTGVGYMDATVIGISDKVTVCFGTEKVTNGGFETGDFTGWVQDDATIDTTNPASGTNAAKLVSSGAIKVGPQTNKFTVDVTKKHSVSAKVDVNAYTAGTHRLEARFFDSEDVEIGASVLKDFTALTSGYETVVKTVGPASASPDIEFPQATVTMYVRVFDAAAPAPTITSYLDSVSVYELDTLTEVTSFALLGHNLASADDIIFEHADDVNFTVNKVVIPVTYHAETLIEFFTGVTKAFWRLIIVRNASRATTREAGRFILGAHYQMERNIKLGWSGPQYTQDTSRNVRTEGGQSYSDIGTVLKTFQGEFVAHGETDLDELEALKATMLTGQAFIIAQNWEDFPIKRTLYGKLKGLGQPSNVAADKWTLPFSMVEQK